jgi:putative sugar O-methyltransferase
VIGVILPHGRTLRRGLRNHLVGYNDALRDYQLFRSADVESQPPILTDVSAIDYGLGEGRPGFSFEFDGNRYSKGMLKYLKGLAFLKRSVDTSGISSVLEIGGGIAALGEILFGSKGQDYFYVDVDIPPMAYLASEYLKQVYGADAVLDYSETRKMDVIDLDEIRSRYRVVVLCPWQLPKVKGSVDLFVNSTSFQEMEPDVVKNYAELVSDITTSFVLINNRSGGQHIADGDGRGVREVTTVNYIIDCFQKFEVVDRTSWLALPPSELVVMRKSNR